MIVTVDVISSKNKKIGSHIIARGTKHLAPFEKTCSHVALLINGRWVHESTGKTGVRVLSLNKWLEHNTLIDKVRIGIEDYTRIKNIFNCIKNRKYDFMGLLYFSLAIIPTFIGFKLPKKNRFESKNKYFCCEAVGYMTGQYYGMSAPVQVIKLIKDRSDEC